MGTYNNIKCCSKSCDFEPPCLCINTGSLTITNYRSDYSGALIINNAILKSLKLKGLSKVNNFFENVGKRIEIKLINLIQISFFQD